MDFTREPVIETVVTPREGYKIVVRSSKGIGQEEHFLDCVEVVSFGNALFYRSNEKPKSFLAPVSDYEVIEVREARMVLKHVTSDKAVKIGKNTPQKGQQKNSSKKAQEPGAEETPQPEKKRERKRGARRRRGREEKEEQQEGKTAAAPSQEKAEEKEVVEEENFADVSKAALLPPPIGLISDTISRYKGNEQFKGAFVERKENEQSLEGAEQNSGNFDAAEQEALAAADSTEPVEAVEPDYSNLPPIPEEEETPTSEEVESNLSGKEEEITNENLRK